MIEASAWGLRQEVKETAEQLINDREMEDPVTAYLIAYEDWMDHANNPTQP